MASWRRTLNHTQLQNVKDLTMSKTYFHFLGEILVNWTKTLLTHKSCMPCCCQFGIRAPFSAQFKCCPQSRESVHMHKDQQRDYPQHTHTRTHQPPPYTQTRFDSCLTKLHDECKLKNQHTWINWNRHTV